MCFDAFSSSTSLLNLIHFSQINQGDQSYKDLQSKLDSLQEKFDEQEVSFVALC